MTYLQPIVYFNQPSAFLGEFDVPWTGDGAKKWLSKKLHKKHKIKWRYTVWKQNQALHSSLIYPWWYFESGSWWRIFTDLMILISQCRCNGIRQYVPNTVRIAFTLRRVLISRRLIVRAIKHLCIGICSLSTPRVCLYVDTLSIQNYQFLWIFEFIHSELFDFHVSYRHN